MLVFLKTFMHSNLYDMFLSKYSSIIFTCLFVGTFQNICTHTLVVFPLPLKHTNKRIPCIF